MSLLILEPGPLTTVQDTGRVGGAAEGYRECGGCDGYALRLANILAGNPQTAAALEYTLRGPTVRFEEESLFALSGAPQKATLDGVPVQSNAPVYAQAGAILEIGFLCGGMRGYLAVYGGVDLPPLLGSRSTDLSCGLGGFRGRALRKGDALPLGAADAKRRWKQLKTHAPAGPVFTELPHARRFTGADAIPLVRCVPGPQEDAFSAQARHLFVQGRYTLSTDSNRMACRFKGPAIESLHGADILSDGIVAGSVQVSGDGRPIVMLADHQTTGGYAKIATVITADLSVLAQLRPGETVGFCYTTPQRGGLALRRRAALLGELEKRFLL